jgi:hypothetical protein
MESESTAVEENKPVATREPTLKMLRFYTKKLFGGRARLLFDNTRVPPYKVVKRINPSFNQIVGMGATPRAALQDAVAKSKPKEG